MSEQYSPLWSLFREEMLPNAYNVLPGKNVDLCYIIIKVLTVYTYISIRIRYTPSTSNNWCSRCPFLLWRLRCWTSRPLDLEPVKHRHLITWSTNGAHVDMCSSSSSLPLYVSRKENEENAFLTELLTYVWHILLFICTNTLALNVLVEVQNVCAFYQNIYFIEILIYRWKFVES